MPECHGAVSLPQLKLRNILPSFCCRRDHHHRVECFWEFDQDSHLTPWWGEPGMLWSTSSPPEDQGRDLRNPGHWDSSRIPVLGTETSGAWSCLWSSGSLPDPWKSVWINYIKILWRILKLSSLPGKVDPIQPCFYVRWKVHWKIDLVEFNKN